MTLRLPGHWVWDTWFAVDGDLVHAFFLHAPRSLGDPDLRHAHARVGHAVSRDLVTWDIHAPVLTNPPAEAPDARATWTGSVVRDGDHWLMAFSGLSNRDDGRFVQRIGLATSPDLDTWTRIDTEIAADPRWYETLATGTGEEHWRDPWAWIDPAGVLHLLITARASVGDPSFRGVIGHAWSRDRRTFEVGPPLTVPGEIAQLEVPQLVRIEDERWALLASVDIADHAPARLARPGFVAETGVVQLDGSSPLGPFKVSEERCLYGTTDRSWYAGRVVTLGGRRWLLGWVPQRDGVFVGELADPIALETGPDGRLRVAGIAEGAR